MSCSFFLLAPKKEPPSSAALVGAGKKRQAKPPAMAGLPPVLPGLPTTVRTIYSLIYFDYSFSLMVQPLQRIAWSIQIDHVLCADTAGTELRTEGFGLKTFV
jgi:hypothetical protein